MGEQLSPSMDYSGPNQQFKDRSPVIAAIQSALSNAASYDNNSSSSDMMLGSQLNVFGGVGMGMMQGTGQQNNPVGLGHGIFDGESMALNGHTATDKRPLSHTSYDNNYNNNNNDNNNSNGSSKRPR